MSDLNQTKVSLIIPAYNAASTIERCLDSILKQDYPNLEIIVVDDASCDDTLTKVSNYNVRIIRHEKNQGLSCSRNTGANEANGQILIFCDSDLIVPPQAISGLVKTLIVRQDKLAVGGVYSENSEGLNFISEYKNCDLAYREQACSADVKYVTGFFMAIRKSEFIKTGGFPEGFAKVGEVEDMEFGYRVTKGFNTMFVQKEVKVRHLKKYNLVSMLKTNFKRIFSMVRLIKVSKGKYKASEHVTLPYFINLFLPWIIILFLVLNIWFKTKWLVFTVPVLFIVNNRGFLAFLVKKRGIIFALRSIVIHFIEYIFIPVFILISGFKLAFK